MSHQNADPTWSQGWVQQHQSEVAGRLQQGTPAVDGVLDASLLIGYLLPALGACVEQGIWIADVIQEWVSIGELVS